MSLERKIAAHYGREGLGGLILEALAEAGKDVEHLSLEDLAPIDEFHVRGRDATLDLGRGLQLGADQRVLDVGSGLGGPSRHLAAAHGCRVTGIDLTEDYCRVAAMLAERVGLAERPKTKVISASSRRLSSRMRNERIAPTLAWHANH